MHGIVQRIAGVAFGAALAAGALVADVARADTCKEWREEHCDWQVEVMRRYLRGAPQRELDAAVFELLQREAYLTSCQVSAERARSEQVGWRLVGRAPDEYGGAVIESVLERAGFDPQLRNLFDFEGPDAPDPPAWEVRALHWRRFGRSAR